MFFPKRVQRWGTLGLRFRATGWPSACACSCAPPAPERYGQGGVGGAEIVFSWLEFQENACYFLEIPWRGGWRQAGLETSVCLRSALRWRHSLDRVFVHIQ